MSYSEDLKKHYKLARKADKVIRVYQRIADDLFSKEASQYASVTRIDIEENGINYEYYIDYYDFSKGRSECFISKDKIESLLETYKRKERKEKLLKMEENI